MSRPVIPRVPAPTPVLAVVVALVALVAPACGGGGGEGGGTTGDATTTSGPLADVPAFEPAAAAFVLEAFGNSLDRRFSFDEDSTIVFDPTAGEELEFDTADRRTRHEFASSQGFAGLVSGLFETRDGGEFWELTSEVYEAEDGARAVFERFGLLGGGSVSNSELLGSEERAFGEGRIGTIVVDRYAFRAAAEGQVHEAGEFLELRGALVDGNVLHFALAVVDLTSIEGADPWSAVRRALSGVDGVYTRAYADLIERVGA